MAVIVEVILPIFAIMLAGYVAARTRLLMEDASEAISQFVYYAAGPALAFISLYRTSLEDFFNWAFLGALGGGMAVTLCFSLLVAVRFFPGSLTAYGLHGMCTMYPSTGYVGIPLLLIAFGDRGPRPGDHRRRHYRGILPTHIHHLRRDRPGQRPIPKSAPALCRRVGEPSGDSGGGPVLGASGSGLQLPTAAVTFFDMLSGAFGPCALFAAGLFMGGRKVRADPKEVTWLVVVKLAIQPLINLVAGISGFRPRRYLGGSSRHPCRPPHGRAGIRRGTTLRHLCRTLGRGRGCFDRDFGIHPVGVADHAGT